MRFESNPLPSNTPSKFALHAMEVKWEPERPTRLTRQQRAKVRAFVRDSARRNHRSTRDLREVEKRNVRKLAEDGDKALVFYLQDQGAGAISVHQVLHPVVVS